MKKLLLITYLVIIALVSCTKDNENKTPIPPAKKDLTIFIVNDVHAQIDNFAKVKYIIDQERKETNVIVTSAGDNFSGNPIVDNYPEKGYPIIDIMNKVGFDVATIGNHEFDYGEENLKNRITQSNFDWICANVNMSNSVIPQPLEYTTISIDNLKVTFLGLIETNGKSDATIPSTHPWKVQNITFQKYSDVVTNYSDLKKQEDSDLYIALTHLGLNSDEKLAQQFPYFDLIIGGHSHSKAYETVNDIPIFQAGSLLKYLGKIKLTVTDKEIEAIQYELIDLQDYTEQDSDLKKVIDEYNNSPFFYEVIGKSQLNHNKYQVGCFTAEAFRKELNVDLTFQNTGGVRANLDKGDIIKKEIYEILPFNNYMIIYEMSVAEIKNFLRGSGSGFYYSGVTLEKVNGSIIVKDFNGNIIPDETILSIGVNDYIPAVHNSFFPSKGNVQPKTDAETVISYLQKIDYPVDYLNCNNYFKF